MQSTVITVRLSVDELCKVDSVAEKTGKTRSEVIREQLDEPGKKRLTKGERIIIWLNVGIWLSVGVLLGTVVFLILTDGLHLIK